VLSMKFRSTSEQECCYDSNGHLITGPPGGGSIKKAPEDVSVQHFTENTRPFLLCCAGVRSSCNRYYKMRPSDNGSRFEPRSPGKLVCSTI